MIPTNSSSSTNGCDNISSNCVVWQGPDIACIDLCSGDTITEVTNKIALKVCDLIKSGVTSNPSLVGLDLSCLNIQGVTPTQLIPVLLAMVVQICANTGNTGGGGGGFNVNDLPIMTLPACLQYTDPSGNPVTELRLDLFATLIAQQVCTNLASINIINSTLTSITARVLVLENCVLPCSSSTTEAQVIPTCILPAVLTNVSVLLLALEARFCSLETAVGSPAAILGTIGQSFIINSTTQLTNPGSNYGSIGGWNTSPVNLAQSVQNAWVVIDDMYTAISNIQLNCCSTGCASVTFGYTNSTNLSSSGQIISITFLFTASTIPAAYNDSAGSTVVTITDANGLSAQSTVSVSTLQNDSAGVTISLPGLNTNQDLTTSVAFNVTDGTETCQENQTQTIVGIVPCPAVTTSLITTTGVTVNFINPLGTAATYLIEIYDTSNIIQATHTVINPTGSITHAFTGLVPITAYYVQLTVTFGGATQICTTVKSFETLSAAIACDQGMDVAFIIDYSSSMGPAVNLLKTGVASVVNAIDVLSATNDYRLGLTLADEGLVNPNYVTNSGYTSLPAAQKVTNTGPTTLQWLTAVEMFQTNNGASFTTQLNLLNTANFVLGSGGAGSAEPVDQAIGLVVGVSAFLNAFRVGANKTLVILTDNLPSGGDDQFDSTDLIALNTLAVTCATNGIRCCVFGLGVNATYTPPGGSAIYPWRIFAADTGGQHNQSYDSSQIIGDIQKSCL